MTTYRYTPFPPTSDPKHVSIRLISLPPGPRTGPISVSIFETRLIDAPDYEVLSYRWGNPFDQSSLYVTPDSAADPLSSPKLEDEYIRIPSSLVPFLYRTRAIGRERIFWIDCISIDQSNEVERSAQVARMRDIYQRASRTLIWLGPAGENSDMALEYAWKLCKKLNPEASPGANISNFEEQKGTHETFVGDPRLEALVRLVERPYFERSWIVQEVVVSRNQWVMCGDRAVHWYVFMCAFLYLISTNLWLFDFYSDRGLGQVMMLRYSQLEWETGKDVKWWRILTRHRKSLAGDPRDKIFAFWGTRCMSDLVNLDIVPDYGLDVKQLYIKFAVQALRRGDTQVLSVPRIVIQAPSKDVAVVQGEILEQPLQPLAIPSWVPDWRSSPGTPESLTQFESVDIFYQSKFNVSPSSEFEASFNKTTDPKKFELYTALKLQGYIVARISQLTPRPWKITKPTGKQTVAAQARLLQYNQHQIWEWLSVIRLPLSTNAIYHPTGETATEAMYKMLTKGELIQESEAQTKDAIDAFEGRQWWLKWMFVSGLANRLWPFACVVLVDRLFRWCGWPSAEMKFRMMVGGMAERKGARLVGETTRDGEKGNSMLYLGLVPGICKEADVVVLCKGVEMPLVLRKKVGAEKREKETEEWELIGDCYVHGVMKGEAWDKVRCHDLWLV